METLALEAIGVSKRYGYRDALCGVDLTARPGCVHGILGPNGAGKTTLIRVLLGLIRPDAGTVHILGHGLPATTGSVPDGVAGFVETPAFYPYLSGRRNLEMLGRLDDMASGAGDSIRRVLDQVGLTPQADFAVAGYSSGMRQRLGLAAALLRSPRLLLLDEPTSSLDAAGARDVRELVRRLAKEGAAVLLSSHDMVEVEELCDTLTIIYSGRVVFTGPIDALRELAPDTVHLLHTSDDEVALHLASERSGVTVSTSPGGLEVSAGIDALDAYVIALGRAGVAVRSLESRARSLEWLFLRLTGPAAS